MKITRVRSTTVVLPIEEPLAGAVGGMPMKELPVVAVMIETDAGVAGLGVTYAGLLTGALARIVDDLGELILGEDPARIEHLLGKLGRVGKSAGPEGLFLLAQAALDTALWDIRGKVCELPLWRLLGGARATVPTYASGALMRGLSLDRVVEAAATLKARGWREMKTQLALPGPTNPQAEVERMVRVREAIGPDVKLMCDINQRWRPKQAVRMGRLLEDAGVGLDWLEDVTTADDLPALARCTAALATPTAAGEYLWGIAPLRHLIAAAATDIVMIDLLRVGGITAWMKVAGLAEAFNLPVASHVMPEIHVHLVGAIPNGLTVEYMPWTGALFEQVPAQEGGVLTAPDTPGLGLTFSPAVLARFAA